YGYNPEGVRIGQNESRNKRAVKIWDKREFRNLAGDIEIGTRTMKLALRRLRRFAREGAAEMLDLPGTIGSTARNAGYLDLKMMPERRNAARVLLCVDIGGSMDEHVSLCEQLFTAARSEFKHLVHLYFHNCPYESLWRDARFRPADRLDTFDVLNTYDQNWKLIFIGDAAMSPYEIIQPGGAVSSWNAESGRVWIQRLVAHFPKSIWINPTPQEHWRFSQSTKLIGDIMEDRMYPLTLEGLDAAMHRLMH
ncbi:MAG TPA: VWA domain-containing protein, partial [Acetobacteraceae bacterium]|nr:VWA domain-containing protein [Acetobacteraceae bacterium]